MGRRGRRSSPKDRKGKDSKGFFPFRKITKILGNFYDFFRNLLLLLSFFTKIRYNKGKTHLPSTLTQKEV